MVGPKRSTGAREAVRTVCYPHPSATRLGFLNASGSLRGPDTIRIRPDGGQMAIRCLRLINRRSINTDFIRHHITPTTSIAVDAG